MNKIISIIIIVTFNSDSWSVSGSHASLIEFTDQGKNPHTSSVSWSRTSTSIRVLPLLIPLRNLFFIFYFEIWKSFPKRASFVEPSLCISFLLLFTILPNIIFCHNVRFQKLVFLVLLEVKVKIHIAMELQES